MDTRDAETIIAIASLAALADGNQDDAERASIAEAATRLGLSPSAAPQGASASLDSLAGALSGEEARRAAYDTAAAVCYADGTPNANEATFLEDLQRALHLSNGPDAAAATAAVVSTASAPSATPPAGDLDSVILDQAIVTTACEILPDRLANMAILPLQLRLVYTIGQRHGQQLDVSQVKDLAAALGIGAAAQVMETMVRKTLGGIAGGLLGGLLGRAGGMAAGAVVTFSATYALGHAADQYYAQGRRLSTADLRALFARFQTEARDMFPRVENRVRTLASSTSLTGLMGEIRR
jgi:uncharacterized protein (DUF697 family)